VVSTGSTLLDLAISGGVYPEGGIPPGILVEVFGPSGCGKTVLLCEIAGAVQRQGGQALFNDPEGRLNRQFAALFGYKYEDADYSRPDTVTEMFEPIRSWKPKRDGVTNGIFADSLAALSTDLEMEGDEGDKMGMRRAKEFSEMCRLTCRVLANRGYLMVCSNQIRQNPDAGKFGQKYKTPGGEAVPFYASLRLRCYSPEKTQRKIKIGGNEHKRVIGVHTTFEVYKSTVDAPYRTAPVHIVFDYGIDDIRANLEFVKSIVGGSFYVLDNNQRLDGSLERSIKMVEEGGLESQLVCSTIQLWREREEKFKVERRPKRRE
jgi:RecA/RadA recombinase